ncbi:MAG: response regulator [Bacteroidetes bacterium]|jgi:CheY-like chemotaxis protein|nr:response regulator [Bacteroidota bacterium]
MKKLKCILLIDDDEDDNFFHHIAIKEANVTEKVVIAESGFKALELLRNNLVSPDLIFLDINMPKMNGWEFLEEYKKLDSSNSTARIIMLSTSVNPHDKERSRDFVQVMDFRTKPLDPQILTEISSHF